WDGRVVIAADAASRTNILNSVESKYRGHISFSDNGTVVLNLKVAPLITGEKMSNYAALQYLVNNKNTIEVHEQQSFKSKDENNQTQDKTFGVNSWTNGITLLPNAPNDPKVKEFSTNNNVQVILPNKLINENNNKKGAITAHELFGHALFYYLNKPAAHNYDENGKDHNTPLKQQIERAEENATK
ncbi:MAG: hypothetical protein KIT33_14885, partial [Candidatus Kapabacteria bacterium]|nr:hypothetical protein [Candidatus Kapabacteria bacterium]